MKTTLTEQANSLWDRAAQIKGQGMMQQAANAPALVEDMAQLLVQFAFQLEALTATNRNLNNRLEKIEPYVDEAGET